MGFYLNKQVIKRHFYKNLFAIAPFES